MMVREKSFLAMLEEQREAATGDDPLVALRSKAWGRFLELGLPSRRVEAYRYLKLRRLYATRYITAEKATITVADIAPYLLPGCCCLVFVNGFYSPELSQLEALPDKTVAMPLAESMMNYRSLLSNQWSKMEQEEADPFAAANSALHPHGLFLYLPPATTASIQLLNIVATGDAPMLLLPRIELFAGKESDVHIVNSIGHVSGRGYGYNQFFNAVIEDAAAVRYDQMHLDQQHTRDVWHFDAVRARLKRSSRFHSVNINSGSATIRSDYAIRLTGEGAEAELDGVTMLADKNESHTHVLIDHQAPHCRSRQLFKSVLKQASKSSFEGKILVRQAAQKTDAFQLNNNLILDDLAHADSKPNLEIFADDVKASHGATFGRLNEEELFYLQSRGYSRAAASSLLIYGFCKEVVERVRHPPLFEALKRWVESYVE